MYLKKSGNLLQRLKLLRFLSGIRGFVINMYMARLSYLSWHQDIHVVTSSILAKNRGITKEVMNHEQNMIEI